MPPSQGSLDPHDHPPQVFPEADWTWFLERSQALAITVPPPARLVLEAWYGHLVGVNAWMNLTRLTGSRAYLKHHILDSLAVLAWMEGPSWDSGLLLDLGSGAGYPGLPLALWRPGGTWILADARRRKAEFLQATARLLPQGRTEALWLRASEAAQTAPHLLGRCSVVTARAVATAAELLEESRLLLSPGGWLVLWKGPQYAADEAPAAAAAARRWGFRAAGAWSVRLEPADPERTMLAWRKT